MPEFRWKLETDHFVGTRVRVGQHLSHPNLTAYDEFVVDTVSGAHYLVREWADGKSLHQYAKEGKRFTDSEIIEIMCKVFDAVEYLHSLNPPVIHRDIKPANIVVDVCHSSEGDKISGVRLIDLGTVPQEPDGANPSTLMTAFGTPGFTASEALANPCKQTDVFSLGATILYLAARKNADDIYDPATATYKVPEDISGRLGAVISKSLHHATGSRYQSVGDMRKALLDENTGLDEHELEVRRVSDETFSLENKLDDDRTSRGIAKWGKISGETLTGVYALVAVVPVFGCLVGGDFNTALIWLSPPAVFGGIWWISSLVYRSYDKKVKAQEAILEAENKDPELAKERRTREAKRARTYLDSERKEPDSDFPGYW